MCYSVIEHTCKWCGKKFSNNKKSSKYCSNACKFKGSSNPKISVCIVCGKEVVDNMPRSHCSNRCKWVSLQRPEHKKKIRIACKGINKGNRHACKANRAAKSYDFYTNSI